MRLLNKIVGVFLFLVTATAWGADANGYTAEYECRAGGPQCNVDVETLTQAACARCHDSHRNPMNQLDSAKIPSRTGCSGVHRERRPLRQRHFDPDSLPGLRARTRY